VPTRKYDRARLDFACWSAHVFPGSQQAEWWPQKNGICIHIFKGSQSGPWRDTQSSKV
jgi:hypothetical protein